MAHIGYVRVSTEKQDSDKQRHLLLEYAQSNGFIFERIIEVTISSTESLEARKVDQLLESITPGDIVVTAELSRFGRNMLKTLNLVSSLDAKGAEVRFIRQPELSTSGRLRPLLLAIYGYLAESEREFLVLRTKQGLAAARAAGKTLGRPKGSRSQSKLDPFKCDIQSFLEKGVSQASICKIIGCSRSALKHYLVSRGIKMA